MGVGGMGGRIAGFVGLRVRVRVWVVFGVEGC